MLQWMIKRRCELIELAYLFLDKVIGGFFEESYYSFIYPSLDHSDFKNVNGTCPLLLSNH